jgi:hypothetical protein
LNRAGPAHAWAAITLNSTKGPSLCQEKTSSAAISGGTPWGQILSFPGAKIPSQAVEANPLVENKQQFYVFVAFLVSEPFVDIAFSSQEKIDYNRLKKDGNRWNR